MRAAARTILEALDRFPYDRREDRLTEVFAYVLRTVPELTHWLIGCVDTLADPCRSEPAEIFTQGAIVGSGRPDLRVEYKDRGGEQRVLLSEHKINSPLTPFQRAGYPGWERDALILIVPDGAGYQQAEFAGCLTWLDVAEALVKLGERPASEQWRAAAFKPQAPSSLRCLHELLRLLEIEDVGVNRMDAIDDAAVKAYARMADVRDMLETFLRLIARDERLQPATAVSSELNRTHWYFDVPSVTWPYLLEIDPEAAAEVALESTATWLAEPDERPILYAGFRFATPQRDLPQQLDSPSMHRALRQIGAKIAIQPNRRQGKCVKTLSLTQVAAEGGTLPRQAQAAASFAVDALQQISSIAP